METERLKYFITIAETGSLTKASEILNLSHSGLSKAVSALEAETKMKLFRPLGRGLEITPEGKWFYQKARDILQIADEVLQGRKNTQPAVRLGLSGVMAITCAAAVTAEFKEPVSIEQLDIGEAEAKIVAGELDFALAFTLSPKSELEYLEVGEVKFGSFAREDLIAKFSGAQLPYAVPLNEYPFNPLGYKHRDGWPQDLPRNPRFAVNCFSIALDLFRGGEAGVYMPEFVAAQENARAGKFAAVKEHKAASAKRKIYLVKRQAAEETAAMKKTAKIIRRVCC